MSSNKVQGMCAPTVVQRKVKGCIFYDTTRNFYFLAPGEGYTYNKMQAHVYSHEEVDNARELRGNNWAAKGRGKWLIVYE